MIMNVLHQVIFVSFFDPLGELPVRGKRVELVNQLSNSWPGRLKTVHGIVVEGDGKSDIMYGKLGLLELGEVEEIGT